MCSNLTEELRSYRKITEQAIISCQNKEYDELNCILNKRQGVIGKLQKINAEKEEFKKIYFKMGIDKLDSELKNLVCENQEEIKEKIKMLSKSASANKLYNSNFNKKAVIFSKKV